MDYGIKAANPEKARYQCAIVGIHEDTGLTASGKIIDKASGGQLKKIIRRGDITGKASQTLMLHDIDGINTARILLVGLGSSTGCDTAKFLTIAQTVINNIKSVPARNVLCCLAEVEVTGRDTAWKVERLVEAFEQGTYTYTEMKGKAPEPSPSPEVIDFLVADKEEHEAANAGVACGVALGLGLAATRDLGNAPANICTPTYLAEKSQQLAQGYKSLTTTVLEESDMKKHGMGAFLSVGKGSVEPSKLIIIEHKGGKPKDQPHIIVGKGITFDTGGISLKPGATMYEMIYDMCGAASVFGTMKAIAEMNLPINIIGVIAAAENMPSGEASKPGDIVKTMSGQTVEILNTDAEGRLVLCDALTYIERYKPATVIDIATLTGAIVVALGSQASGMFANDDGIAADLNAAGETTYDRVWRLPIWDEYQTQINCAFADMQNIGGREAGSITAACFLSRFTKSYRWAHLDIAGTAYRWAGMNKGATGRSVSLLTQYLRDRVADA